jgi:hypothetical protein
LAGPAISALPNIASQPYMVCFARDLDFFSEMRDESFMGFS